LKDVPARIEFSGGIESICQDSAALSAGMTAKIVFKLWDDVTPPVTIKVRGPDGKMILDRVLREIPVAGPQSVAPVTFLVASAGVYQIHVKELYGQVEGNAKLTVS
jgi:hypothetical protein